MTNGKTVKYWFDMARYDLITARAMLKTKRYLYVAFMCHQTIEKIIKGLYVKRHGTAPPYIHNLPQLADRSGLVKDLNDGQLDLLRELQPFNIEARYPTYKEEMLKTLNQRKCAELLRHTKGLYQWLRKQ